ncbi:MAG: hypothetical protein FH748_06115 [Balneolaceae bacterium]|nr:hypothetical protein [Balneolaceae bacterium]
MEPAGSCLVFWTIQRCRSSIQSRWPYNVFISTRPTKEGQLPKEGTDIWMMQKRSTGWDDPQRVAILNSDNLEWFPSVTDNGTIYFGSERQGGNLEPKGTSDLWRSRLVNEKYTEPENLGNIINTPGNDIEGYIAPDESFLIFSSNGYKNTRGTYDLYISYNREGAWTKPQNLGDMINSEGWEFGAKLSPDGKYLFFTSNRSPFNHPLEKRLDYEELIRKFAAPVMA